MFNDIQIQLSRGDAVTGETSTFCLIDASGYVFRAYHAIRNLTNGKGMATNAIYGYINMLNKAVLELAPTHIAVVMDPVGKSFRHDLYPEYKANRPPVPEDLKEQFPYIEPVTEALGYPCARMEGFEADDLIATLAIKGRDAGMKVVVVSADKDLTQLVGRGVTMYDPMRDKWWTSDAVVEKFGVPPEKIADLLAIMGDSSDNVPGIKGIGAKGAAKLIQQYGTLEEILASRERITAKRQREALEEFGDTGLFSKQLVTLRYNVPVEQNLENFRPRQRDNTKLKEMYTLFNFRRLLAETLPASDEKGGVTAETPPMGEVTIITTRPDLENLVARIGRAGRLALDTETTSTRPTEARLVGISTCLGPDDICYIPIAHRSVMPGGQLTLSVVRDVLGPVLADAGIAKVGQNFKYDAVVLRAHGFGVAGLTFDTLLAAYLLDPGGRGHSLDALAAEYLGVKLTSFKEVTGGGGRGKQVTFDYVPLKSAARYAGEDAWATWLLAEKFSGLLDEAGVRKLFETVEVPLSDLLARIEEAGVAIDLAALNGLSADYAKRLVELETECHGLAGIPFNLGSPKQLAEILFDRLDLPRKKKTKTGYSTDVKVLEELAEIHPLPLKMLEHRSLAKLKSTYSDVLPTLVHHKTQRIHTSFNQAVTATGRLSSSEPNLQNIPIRGEEGKKIRAAFVPQKGHLFLAADYSQVELRIMAHLAKDDRLTAAFRQGEDIHSRTAREIFGVLPGMVTADMRRVAKTINFGIIYGMSAFRLASEQKISVKMAKEFILRYFERYSGVKQFLHDAVEDARDKGYAETLLGRRRYLPDLRASNHNVRSMAERMAVNTPVQGGAADIVKLAMLNLQQRLDNDMLPAFMVLQVHDELVLEITDPSAASEVAEVVRNTMESAYPLDVPLKVDIGIGPNWAEVHG
jgi:DNA polymerase I